MAEVDALIFCLPTPLTEYREPDLHFIHDTLKNISPYIHREMLLSLESATYPGTTEEVIQPAAEANDLKAGEDIYLVYSPERGDPGNKQYPPRKIPIVCGGITNTCNEHGQALNRCIVETVVSVSSTEAAEMTKLFENIHRSVNICKVNDIKMVVDKMGINIHEVIDAAAKHFGFTKYSLRPRPRRSLHSHQPLLSDLESKRVQYQHPLYRTLG